MTALLKAIATLLFICALPLAIVLTNMRLMVFDRDLWMSGYARWGVTQTTGMSQQQLQEASDQIIRYFEHNGPMVSMIVQKEWGAENLFNEREQQHLVDVRNLLDLAVTVQQVSLAYVIVFAAFLILRRMPRWLARSISAGTLLTLAIFGIIGLLAVSDFQRLWLQFHLVSFSNDLWSLDPRTDYMIRMYPLGFWFDMVSSLVARSGIVAAGLLVVSQVFLRFWPHPDAKPKW